MDTHMIEWVADGGSLVAHIGTVTVCATEKDFPMHWRCLITVGEREQAELVVDGFMACWNIACGLQAVVDFFSVEI